MLPNQVNFRELFSNPGAYLNRSVDHYDSQSNSQMPYSQVDFPDSQEQNSQSSLSNSPGKKFYSRYGGGRGLVRQNSQENVRSHLSAAVKLTNQQLQNNITRAKDRDERDLLNSILSSVKESSGEVLTAVAVVRDNLYGSEKATDAQLEKCFTKIHETIERCNREVMTALEVKELHKDALIKKSQELLVKETQIADLENQLEAARQATNGDLIDKLTKISETQHRKSQEKVRELFSIHKQDLAEYADRQHQTQVTGLKDAQQHLKQLSKLQETQLKDNNTKLGQKIQQVTQQSKTMNDKLLKDIKENMKTVQKQFKLEVDKLLEKQAQLTSVHQPQQDACQDHRHEVYRLLEDYKLDLSIKLTEQLDGLLAQQEGALADVIKTCLEDEKTRTDLRHQQIQENIHQRIEEEIKKLEESHKKQLEKVMDKLKMLAPPTTPKIPPILIPPPTPEQFKQQMSPIPPPKPEQFKQQMSLIPTPTPEQLKKRTTPISLAITKQTKQAPVQTVSSIDLPKVTEQTEKFLQTQSESTQNLNKSVLPQIAKQPEASEQLPCRVTRSRNKVMNTERAERQTTATSRGTSSTTTELTELLKTISPVSCASQVPMVTEGQEQGLPSTRAVSGSVMTAHLSPAVAPKSMWNNSLFSQRYSTTMYSSPIATVLPLQAGKQHHCEPIGQEYNVTGQPSQGGTAPGTAMTPSASYDDEHNTSSARRNDSTVEVNQINDDIVSNKRNVVRNYTTQQNVRMSNSVVRPESRPNSTAAIEPELHETGMKPQPQVKSAPKKRRKRKRFTAPKPKKKVAQRRISPEMSVIAKIQSDDECDYAGTEIEDRESESLQEISGPSQIAFRNEKWSNVVQNRPAASGRSTGGNSRYAPYNQRAPVSNTNSGYSYEPRGKATKDNNYSFKSAFKNVCSGDMQRMPMYAPMERSMPPIYQAPAWSHIAPHMRSYTSYSYSSSRPSPHRADLYEFTEDTSPLAPRNPLSYNGTAWKRKRDTNRYRNSSMRGSNYGGREVPDTRWQAARQIEGTTSQQHHTEPFEELAVIPYEDQSEEDEPEDQSQQEEEYSQSRESSPSMSVTEVFIKRKFRRQTKTAEPNALITTQSDDGLQDDYENDFLSNATHQHNGQTGAASYQIPQVGMKEGKKRAMAAAGTSDATKVFTTEMMAVKRSYRQRNARN